MKRRGEQNQAKPHMMSLHAFVVSQRLIRQGWQIIK